MENNKINLKSIKNLPPLSWVALTTDYKKIIAKAPSLSQLTTKIKNIDVVILMVPPEENFAG